MADEPENLTFTLLREDAREAFQKPQRG